VGVGREGKRARWDVSTIWVCDDGRTASQPLERGGEVRSNSSARAEGSPGVGLTKEKVKGRLTAGNGSLIKHPNQEKGQYYQKPNTKTKKKMVLPK